MEQEIRIDENFENEDFTSKKLPAKDFDGCVFKNVTSLTQISPNVLSSTAFLSIVT